MKRILLLIFTISLISCEHDDFTPLPGKGGKASMTILPQHHTKSNLLDSMVVYVKYGATDIPTDGIYDDSAVCNVVDSTPYATFNNLQNGQYYFYSKGYDHYVLQRVKGGTGFRIKEQIADTITLAVTEGDH